MKITGDTSDGYHTFNELYEFRLLYNAALFNEWDVYADCPPVTKSWKHSDGELCFGGGWFVVTAQLPTGQITNHYEAKDWELFRIPEVEKAPEWDGHTPQDVAKRLREFLAPNHSKERSDGTGRILRRKRDELTKQATELITADRKRVALEARINEIGLMQHQARVNLKTSNAVAEWGDIRIAELKAQQEEV